MFTSFTVTARWLLLCILCVPVVGGFVGVVFPALGYFPAIGATQFSAQPFATLFATNGIAKMMLLSLFTGLGSTLLAFIGACCLLAWCYQTRFVEKLQALLSPFLVFPHAAAAIALLFVLSPSGFFARLFTTDTDILVTTSAHSFPHDPYGLSVLFALALKELPFILLMALGVMSQPIVAKKISGYSNVGASLGYTSVARFFLLVLPTIFPQIRLPLLAVLVFATSNVEIPLILGPNNPSTLAVAVLHWFNHIDLSMRLLGSAGAVLQVGISSAALGLFVVGERIVAVLGRALLVNGNRRFFDNAVVVTGASIFAVYMVLIGTIMYSTFAYSVASYWVFPNILPEDTTWLHWQTVVNAIEKPLSNTLVLGGLVSTSSVLLVLFALESQVLKPTKRAMSFVFSVSVFLPLLVPGVAFLYGLVWLQQLVLQSATWFHTYIAHMVYVVPYVYLSLAVAYRKFDARYIVVAQSLGKSPWQVFVYIKLPLMLGAILIAWALGLAISFSQYLPTLLASGGVIPTVTTEAVASASGSSTRLSAVYVIIQATLPLIGFVLAWTLPRFIFNPKQGVS